MNRHLKRLIEKISGFCKVKIIKGGVDYAVIEIKELDITYKITPFDRYFVVALKIALKAGIKDIEVIKRLKDMISVDTDKFNSLYIGYFFDPVYTRDDITPEAVEEYIRVIKRGAYAIKNRPLKKVSQ